ncbi:MAG: CHAT domain-containing protein, partial [Pseudomonadota bacterium]
QIAVEQRATGGSMDGRFIGFGNPKLDGASGEVVEGPGFEDGLAIPDAVKRLEPLPNTERELQAMAATLGFERSTITTGSRASEYTVRNTDFSGASVVTFATHGLLSGEISGLPEPALVFTPPWIWSTRTDDGLLLMSELRQMKLDAQWVIFSACNTAGGGGDGQEGLSGLASAALYAGAERLLVSHWAVRDDATADLTTAMMQILIDEPTLAGSAALQRAMLLLMTEKDSYASPDAWAAFVVVGGR